MLCHANITVTCIISNPAQTDLVTMDANTFQFKRRRTKGRDDG
ncbi:MAG: hypothetical protein AAF664_03630 [Planctomycetota bacterium]